MSDPPRKKSPRAPSIPLDEAIDRVMRVYDKENRHPAPTEVVAQDLGYKSSTSGAALSVLASLRYYGLLERPQEGKLAVSKDVESYRFAPSEEMRRELLIKWLKSPPIFAELLEKYQNSLPSDASLRYDLIQRGFTPVSSASVITIFQRSVQFAGYFDRDAQQNIDLLPSSDLEMVSVNRPQDSRSAKVDSNPVGISQQGLSDSALVDFDRIPIRLSGNRRAYILVPTPFYAADKGRLKAQIDLILTDDENE